MKLFISLFTLITLCAFTPNDHLKAVQFLEGTWKMEKKENYETWKISGDTALLGNSYMIKSKKQQVSEYLSVKEINGNLVYTATVLNQNNAKPVDFVLNKNVTNKLSFENMQHDFPKKIQYTKINDTTIFVEVLGEGDKGFSYKMIKQ